MKNIKVLSISLIIATVFLPGCYKEIIEPGNMTTEKRVVENFNGIDVGNAMQVYISQGDTEEVEIEAYSGYLPHIITQNRGGVLYIYFDKTLARQNIYKDDPKVYLTAKNLSKIRASGATRITGTNNFQAENFDIGLSGASRLNLDLSISEVLYCELSGDSEAVLSGNAPELNGINISGASRLKAFGLITEKTSLNLSGASHAEVYVTEELSASASGASKIKYKGNPAIVRQNTSGASQVIKQ